MLERFFHERRYRLNAHAHSTYSDGALTPQEIDTLIQQSPRKNFLVAITDHCDVRAHEEFVSPHILPGLEVKVEEGGVDVLLYHEREKLLSFFYDVVEPARDPRDPLYGATRLKLLSLLGVAHEAGFDVVIPHYSHNEGLSILPEKTQREVAKFPIVVEQNALLSHSANSVAKEFARAVGRPLLASGDSHLSDQYLSTYTSIPLPRGVSPTMSALLSSLREHPKRARLRLRATTPLDRLWTGWQVLQNAGAISIATQYARAMRWWFSGGGPVA